MDMHYCLNLPPCLPIYIYIKPEPHLPERRIIPFEASIFKAMAKHFKLRINRVIRSFQICSNKDYCSALPEDPVPSFLRPASKPHRSSFKRHLSSAFTTVGCGLGSKFREQLSTDDDSPGFEWQKEGEWHVVAKVYDETPRRKIYCSSVSGDSDDEFFPPAPPPTAAKKKRRSRKKATRARLRFSTSSAESGLFSSEGGDERDDEETETLVSSSRSFSTDSSSELNPQLETINETPIRRRHKKKKRANRAKVSPSTSKVKIFCRSSVSEAESESPARLSVFKKLIPCAVEGKVKESFAVVKKSEDPYEDFKRSMMEMILEKHMVEDRDLEQLLLCFLSLNSHHHHRAIVEAFTEIWDAMFLTTS
ncbi:transcription repressor OFP7-like [Diospyros lotus]|uniref:transcription repressor OFP7-like n=1 Tax=Diospyros lotus TaxID=55363 RepID=UPI002256C8CB|nr:transcription repressor OFP7-like [Diospyros lotus]